MIDKNVFLAIQWAEIPFDDQAFSFFEIESIDVYWWKFLQSKIQIIKF